jgi:polyhydroxyalkanoate synthesis regulator phasin
MDPKFSLRNLLLAGVGTVAFSLEKAMEIIDELVKKGELTVNQGKELNQELKNKFAQQKPESPGLANLATKEDIKKLEARITRLEELLPPG